MRVDQGVTTAAYADRAQLTEYRSIRGKPIWAYIVGSLAIASLAASVGLGVRAAREPEEDRDKWSKASDGALGAALALGTAAGILYFVERRATGTERLRGKASTPKSKGGADASVSASTNSRTSSFKK